MASFHKKWTPFVFVGVLLLTSVIPELVLDQDKIDCYPELGNQTLCESRGCTWEESRTEVVKTLIYDKKMLLVNLAKIKLDVCS